MTEECTDFVLSDGKREVIDSFETAKSHGDLFELDWVLLVEPLGANAPNPGFISIFSYVCCVDVSHLLLGSLCENLIGLALEAEAGVLRDAIVVRHDSFNVEVEEVPQWSLDDKEKPGNCATDLPARLLSLWTKQVSHQDSEGEGREPEEVLDVIVGAIVEDGLDEETHRDTCRDELHDRHNHGDQPGVFEKVSEDHDKGHDSETEEPEHDEEQDGVASTQLVRVEDVHEEGDEEAWQGQPDAALDQVAKSIDPCLHAHNLEGLLHLGLSVLNHTVCHVDTGLVEDKRTE